MSFMTYIAHTLLGAAVGHVSVLQAAKAQSILLDEFLFFSNRFHSEGSVFGQKRGYSLYTRNRTETHSLECPMLVS